MILTCMRVSSVIWIHGMSAMGGLDIQEAGMGCLSLWVFAGQTSYFR